MNTNMVYPTQVITDWFFHFVGGHRLSYSIGKGDKIKELPTRFEVRLRQTPETAVLYKAHLLAVTTLKREVIIYPKGESPVEKTVASILDRDQLIIADRQRRFNEHRQSLSARNPVKEP